MSWKDYFYYTNAERKGIFSLITLVLIALIIVFTIDIFIEKKQSQKDFSTEILKFKEDAYIEKNNSNKKNNSYKYIPKLKPTKKFDPNTISESQLSKIGFNKAQINNIMNYRKAGGVFYDKEDFKNIYTISDSEFEIIKNYIEINIKPKKNKKFPKKVQSSNSNKDKIIYKKLNIELNSASKDELMKVYGIGSVISERIVKYRNLLGGFYNVSQLNEVYGIDSAKYIEIYENFYIDNSLIKKIEINDASNFDLKKHPYIDDITAYLISNRKRQNGDFDNINQLDEIEKIKEADLKKLKHYLYVR